jgi:hypothetical protein
MTPGKQAKSTREIGIEDATPITRCPEHGDCVNDRGCCPTCDAYRRYGLDEDASIDEFDPNFGDH